VNDEITKSVWANIRCAQTADVNAVEELARLLAPQEGQADSGFLVSPFERSDYERFLRDPDVTFLVVTNREGAVLSFLIAYGRAYAARLPADCSEAVVLAAVAPPCDVVVIKQVGVHPEARGEGLARRLYGRLFEMRAAEFAFAATVERPLENRGSKAFHRKLGFTPVLQSSPDHPQYGDTLRNLIWMRQLRPPVHFPLKDDLVESEDLFGALEHARELYKHEDQLNWTKLSQLITVLFALLTAAWFLLNKGASLEVSVGRCLLVILGFLALFAVRDKLRSGARFMASHKTAVRLLEGALALRHPGFVAPLWHVPQVSRTSIWLGRLPFFSLCLWGVVSVALMGATVIDHRQVLGF